MPTAVDDERRDAARALARAIEAVVAQVYFAPEAHERYEALGFGGSPGATPDGVALPDGPAYFTSRGSAMGQVPGELVAAAFGVFKPAVVVPAVAYGWTLTDAATIADERLAGAVDQLRRILGGAPEGIDRANELLARGLEGLHPSGRALFAGTLSQPLPGEPLGDLFRLGDRLREYRGDAHIAAWVGAGFDAVEIGLLTELYWGMPSRSYVRTRAWSSDDLDAGQERLRSAGILDGEGQLTDAGRTRREQIEHATDDQMAPVIQNLGDDLQDLLDLLNPWSKAIMQAGGYPNSPLAISPT